MHPYFHFCVLVEDVGEAVPRFARTFGVEFTPVTEVRSVIDEPEPTEYMLRVAYSTGDPPYIELLGGQGDGVFSLARGEHVHHVGVYEAEFEQSLERAKADGSWAATIRPRGGAASAWFSAPALLNGLRIEHVDPNRRPSVRPT
jgi:hypothetical protein